MPDVSTTAAATAAPEVQDDLGSTIRAAFDKQTEAAPAPEAPVAKVAEAPAVTPAPDKAPEAKPVEKTPAEAAAAAVQGTEPTLTPEQKEAKARTDQIPIGWKGGAAAWHAQAPEVKQYVADTIRNASMKIEQQAPAVKFANEVANVFRPHEGFLRAHNATPVAAAQYLMDGYVMLKTGSPAQRAQVIQNLAAEAGVDLASIQAGDVPKVDPEVQRLRDELQQVTSFLQNQQHTAKSAEEAQLASELQTFQNDPAHEHFETVRGDMGALMLSGQAKDLQDAYDKACWANPEIRSSLVNKQIAQESERRKKEAEAAQRAAVSITGAPTGAGPSNLGDMDLRQAIEHQMLAAGGRV